MRIETSLPMSERNVHVRRENGRRGETSRILERMLGFDVRKPHVPLASTTYVGTGPSSLVMRV